MAVELKELVNPFQSLAVLLDIVAVLLWLMISGALLSAVVGVVMIFMQLHCHWRGDVQQSKLWGERSRLSICWTNFFIEQVFRLVPGRGAAPMLPIQGTAFHLSCIFSSSIKPVNYFAL